MQTCLSWRCSEEWSSYMCFQTTAWWYYQKDCNKPSTINSISFRFLNITNQTRKEGVVTSVWCYMFLISLQAAPKWNPIYYFYEEVAQGADGTTGESGSKHYKCYYGNWDTAYHSRSVSTTCNHQPMFVLMPDVQTSCIQISNICRIKSLSNPQPVWLQFLPKILVPFQHSQCQGTAGVSNTYCLLTISYQMCSIRVQYKISPKLLHTYQCIN